VNSFEGIPVFAWKDEYHDKTVDDGLTDIRSGHSTDMNRIGLYYLRDNLFVIRNLWE
jgi:hypothetical protein